MHSRRRHLRLTAFILAGLCAALRAGAQAPVAPPATASLKATFSSDFLVGVALNARQFADADPQATALIAREFNSATAENAMKWEMLEPANNQFDFAAADRFIDYCRRHELVVIGHNLCWHAQLPSWVSKPDAGQETLTRDVLLARLKNHITTVAGHFKGRVHGWDVVNEAIKDGPGKDGMGEYRQSVFYRIIGKEYLALAFKWAHEADPDAELYYNDYNLDADDAKRARAIELVHYLREQGAPIHGIGLQGHYNLTTPSAAKIDETIRMFSELGLKVMITELDVEAIRGAPVTGAVGANTDGAPRPRFFPALDTLKTKLALTDAEVARIAPLIDKATAEIGAVIAAGDYHLIGDLRTAAAEAIGKPLTAAQRTSLAELMAMPRGGQPVGPPPKPLTPAEQQDLARRYGEIFAVFMKHREAITRVTFWGLRDGDSWRRRTSPLVFDDNYQPKPAYDAVIAAKRATP